MNQEGTDRLAQVDSFEFLEVEKTVELIAREIALPSYGNCIAKVRLVRVSVELKGK